MPPDTAPTPAETQIATFISGETLDGATVEQPKPRSHHAQPKAAEIVPAEADDDLDGDDTTEDAPQDKHRSAQDRINKAVGRQRAAERKLDERDQTIATMASRLDALERGTPPKQDLTKPAALPIIDADKEPNPADFKFGELDPKYTAAVARYATRQALKEHNEAAQTATKARDQAAAATEIQVKVAQVVKLGAEKYPDFQDIVEAADKGKWPLSAIIGELLLDSPHGHDVAHQLGTNLELAKEVYAMSPARQAMWFGKQEAIYEAKTPSPSADDGTPPTVRPSVTQAPAPLKHQLRTTGAEPITADTADFAKFEAMVAGQKPKR